MLHGFPDKSRPRLIRTDFSDDGAWRTLVRNLQATADGAEAVVSLEPLETSACDAWTLDDFRKARIVYGRSDVARVYLADAVTMTHPERPVLVMVQSDDWPWDTCRVHPSAVGTVDVQLKDGSSTVAALAEAVDPDGIYRDPAAGSSVPITTRVWREGDYRLGVRLLYRSSNKPFVGDDVLELQLRLGERGFDVGASDGVFGRLTEDALRAFQHQRDLLADGCCGPVTLRALSGNEEGGDPCGVREPRRPVQPHDQMSGYAPLPDDSTPRGC